MEKVQILGAGLTGLSAAHHLLKAGFENFEIHEKLGWVGGHAITLAEDGFRFDRTGHLLHLRDPEIGAWVRGLLEGQTVTAGRNSRVFSHGRYTRYPYQANTYGLPPDIAYECLMGYLEAQANQATIPEPTNFEEFCLKYFGAGFSKHFMIPYNQRLWGAHPKEMSTTWCQRFVPMPKMEDVIAGAVGRNDRELGYNASFIYPRLGIGELPKAMSAGLESYLRFESAPTGIDWKNKKLMFEGGEKSYHHLIGTLPLDELVKRLIDAPADVLSAAQKLRCSPLHYLDVALKVPCKPDDIDLHWAYVPEEKYPFYRIGCYSNFSSDMAPAGQSCLYIELADRQVPVLSELLPKVVQGLIEMRIIKDASEVLFAKVRTIGHAYVLYDQNYDAALAVIKPFLQQAGITAAGRYGDWNYSSMEDALIMGRDAAARAIK